MGIIMVGPPWARIAMEGLYENFDEHVKTYHGEKIVQFKEGKNDELQKELIDLKDFLNLIYNGEVDTATSEQDFVIAKVKILENLLNAC